MAEKIINVDLNIKDKAKAVEFIENGTSLVNKYVTLTGDQTITGYKTIKAPYRDTYTLYNVYRFNTSATPVETVIYTGIKYVSSTHMPVIHMYGYAYGLNSPIELKIGFYIYGGNLGWSGVVSMGAWQPEVYLFKYTKDGVDFVALGLKGSCYYPGYQFDVQVPSLGSLDTTNILSTGWSSAYITDGQTSIIPAVGTNNCIKVSYKSTLKSLTFGTSTYDGTSALTVTPSMIGALAATAQAADSAKLNGQAASYYLNYNNLTNKPTIPSVGTLNTTATTSQSTSASESLGGSITLHKVAKTGSYDDLLNKPTIPTVYDWAKAPSKPSYTATEVTYDSTRTVKQQIDNVASAARDKARHIIISYNDTTIPPGYPTDLEIKNSLFNSNSDSIDLISSGVGPGNKDAIIDDIGNVVYIKDLKEGDIIFVIENGVPHRWFRNWSDVTFYRLESANYQPLITATNKLPYSYLSGTPTIPSSSSFVNLTDTQTISGTKTFTSSLTQIYGLRIGDSSGYNGKINFGDGDYVYLHEYEDDSLRINAKNLDLAIASKGALLLNGSAGSDGQVLTSHGDGTPPTWTTPGGGGGGGGTQLYLHTLYDGSTFYIYIVTTSSSLSFDEGYNAVRVGKSIMSCMVFDSSETRTYMAYPSDTADHGRNYMYIYGVSYFEEYGSYLGSVYFDGSFTISTEAL